MRLFKPFLLNFGPQHPSAHGVLRLIVNLQGEWVKWVDPHIGLLHRGTEKLIEHKTVLQALPYFDRLDYVSVIACEHTFALLIEKAINLEIPLRAQLIRTLFLEITRIMNHLLAVTTHALDVGALTPFLWAFEEREKIIEFYERVSGARIHANYIRPGGVSQELPIGLLDDIREFCGALGSRLNELHYLLSGNMVWKKRLLNVGIITIFDAIDWRFSGVMLRATGFGWDLRASQPYEQYPNLNFRIPIGTNSDCYDRYLLRIFEIKESISIMQQCLRLIEPGLFKTINSKAVPPIRKEMKASIEGLIHHFKLFSEGILLPRGITYLATEAPKGEFGAFLISNGTNIPYRCKINAPGYYHLQAVNTISHDHFLSDLVTIIGTQDIVFGEIDR